MRLRGCDNFTLGNTHKNNQITRCGFIRFFVMWHDLQNRASRKKRQKTYETNRLGGSAAKGVFGDFEVGLENNCLKIWLLQKNGTILQSDCPIGASL
jgi:hypothetical protein